MTTTVDGEFEDVKSEEGSQLMLPSVNTTTHEPFLLTTTKLDAHAQHMFNHKLCMEVKHWDESMGKENHGKWQKIYGIIYPELMCPPTKLDIARLTNKYQDDLVCGVYYLINP